MARGGDGLGPMGIIISVVTGVVVLLALYSFIPTIGTQIQSSITIPSTSIWGIAGTNDAFTNASEIWTSVSSLPVLAILALFIAVAIGYFIAIGRR